MSPRKKRIGELLIEHGAINSDQLEEALALQKERGGRVCQVLIDLGYLSEERLLECLGSQTGVVSVNVRQYTINPELLQYVPREFAVQHELMPLDKLGKNLTVAMAVPLDEATRAALEEQTGLRVRAVLCSRSDVHSTIEQYYGVSMEEDDSDEDTEEDAAGPAPEQAQPGPEAVRLRALTDLLEQVDQFPLLPEVHTRILEQIREPEASVGDLTDLIRQDPTLSANILKLANSAAYAVRDRFDSVQRAIAYIGLRDLQGIVLSTAVIETMNGQTNLDLTRLFTRAFHCGLLTKIIGDQAHLGDRDMAFTAGLLHNIGDIAVRVFRPERLDQIESAAEETGLPRASIEDQMLGTTASEIGYQLTQRWNIPDNLGHAIRYYDRLDTAPDVPPVAYAVAMAVHCIRRDDEEGGFGDPADQPELAKLLQTLQLSPQQVPQIETLYHDGMENLVRLDPSIM